MVETKDLWLIKHCRGKDTDCTSVACPCFSAGSVEIILVDLLLLALSLVALSQCFPTLQGDRIELDL